VDISHFRRCLEIGRGRAALDIQCGTPDLFRDDLLYACTNNTVYDPQCEEERAPYLLRLIELTAEPQLYHEGILAALATADDSCEGAHRAQLFDLALAFAKRGDTDARRTMYTAFERIDFTKNGCSCAGALIQLDGIDAFLLATEKFSQIEPDEQLWQFQALLRDLQERDGAEPTNQVLAKIANGSPASEIARLLEADRDERAQPKGKRADAPHRDYTAIKAEIKKKGGRVYYAPWGKTATEDELTEAAHDVLAESDENRLASYLSIFQYRKFPRSHDRLLSLIHHENTRVAWRAINALAHITDPGIRALAIDLMRQTQRYGDAVELLRNNSQPGDYLILERLLEEQMNDEDLHDLGVGVRHFVEAHLTGEAVRSLILLYEKGPCGMCRHACVEHLIALDKLPEWMRNECRYDSYSATRELMNT
jgi:hypothetical protein